MRQQCGSPHFSYEETEARRSEKAGPRPHSSKPRATFAPDSFPLQHTASEGEGTQGSVPLLGAAWRLAVGLPQPEGTPDSEDVLEASLERQRPPQYRWETSSEPVEAHNPVTGSWGRRTSQRKLASFAHKACILSHMHWHRHSQTRASKGWTMKQTLARAKDLFFFPSAKPRSYSTLRYNLQVCWNFYRKVERFLVPGFWGQMARGGVYKGSFVACGHFLMVLSTWPKIHHLAFPMCILSSPHLPSSFSLSLHY